MGITFYKPFLSRLRKVYLGANDADFRNYIKIPCSLQVDGFRRQWGKAVMQKSFVLMVLVGLGVSGWGQASLPLTRTAWANCCQPTGWSHNSGVNRTTNFACTGNNGGSLQSTGSFYRVNFNSAPGTLTYSLKSGGISGGSTLLVQQSPDGTNWSTIATFTTITPAITCNNQSHALLAASRYVQFIYTKFTGNVDIDDVGITAAAASVIPTKFAITNISPVSPIAGNAFSVTVAAQDALNVNGNVINNTSFTLTTNGNAGAIGGTTTGTINAGNSSVTVTGVILPSVGTGVTLTADFISGDNLSSGTSSTFSVLGAPVIQWINTSNATAWYTSSNWSPSTTSSGWTVNDIAQFNNTGTVNRAGINLNTSDLSIGAVEVTNVRTRTLDIGNSSSTSNGNVTLNGANVNGVPNTVLRNGSSQLFTLEGAVENESAGFTATYRLGNATNNVINTDGVGGITISAVLTSTPSGTLTKIGSGTLTLIGANTYTGATTVNGGVLNIRSATALGTTAAGTTVSSGSALEIQGGIAVGAEALNLSGTGIGTNGALRNISGTNSYAGAITLAATSTIQSDAGALTISGNITSATFGLTLKGASGGTVSGVIGTTSGTLTKNDAGTWNLTSANTYTGTTTISAGVLNIRNATALGTTANGTTVSIGAALEIQGDISVGTEALSLSGTGIATNGALRNISGNNSYAGAITLAAASTIQSDAGALTLSGGVSGAFGLTLEGAAGGTVSGAIATTTGSLTKNDLGSWTLTGANTYAGTTTINSGILLLNRFGGATLAAAAVVTINSGGTLRVMSDQTLTNLTLNAGAFLTVDDGVTLTITGTFAYNGGTINSTGTAAMAYAGTGVIIYAGSRTTGIEWTATNNPNAVTINGAAVVALAANATTTGNLTINSTAQLVGTGFTLTVGGDWNSVSSNANPYTGGFNSSSLVVLNGSGARSFTHTGGATFRNLTFSGSGTYTINSNITISVNTLTISNGIVVVGTNTLNGSGGLTMSGGILRLAKLSTALPELGGPYALTGGTVELNGVGTQILNGTPDFFNLTFSGNGTTTVSSAVTIAGLVTISTANTILDVSNNSFGGAATDFTMTGGRFRTQGTGTKPDMEDNFNLTGGVVEFYGNAGTIRSKAYQNIEVTGTNVGNSSGNITLNSGGSFTVRTGGTFTINADAITGPCSPQTVTVENGATFNCGNVEGLVGPPLVVAPFNSPAIRDNIENIVLAAGSTINYTRATVAQKFTPRTDYSNVTISGGGEKIVQGPTTLQGILTLTNGIITTTSTNALTLTPTATTSGGSNASFVNGPMQKQVTAVTGNFVFPVGKGAAYQPVTISETNDAGTFRAEYFPSGATTSPRNVVLGAIFLGVWANKYWDVERVAGPTTLTARVGLPYVAGGDTWFQATVKPSSNVAVAHFTAGGWRETLPSGNFNDIGPSIIEAIVNTGSGTIFSGTLTSFSPFTIGWGSPGILPLQFTRFTVQNRHNTSLLEWTVADATSADYYEIEYGTTPHDFVKVGKLIAHQGSQYQFTHAPAAASNHYYRIKARLKSGGELYSKVEKFTNIETATYIYGLIQNLVMQQDARVKVYTRKAQNIHMQLFDMSGRLLIRKSGNLMPGENIVSMPASLLAAGMYRLSVTTDDGIQSNLSFIK